MKSASAMRRVSESGPAFAGPAGSSTPPLHVHVFMYRLAKINVQCPFHTDFLHVESGSGNGCGKITQNLTVCC